MIINVSSGCVMLIPLAGTIHSSFPLVHDLSNK